MNRTEKIRLAGRMVRLARMLLGKDDVVKIKSAVGSPHVRGIVVGITPDNKVLVFKKEDYDNRGNLEGPFKDVTSIAGENGFYLLAYTYTDENMEHLNLKESDRRKLIAEAKKFLRENKSSSATDDEPCCGEVRTAKDLIDMDEEDAIEAILNKLARKVNADWEDEPKIARELISVARSLVESPKRRAMSMRDFRVSVDETDYTLDDFSQDEAITVQVTVTAKNDRIDPQEAEQFLEGQAFYDVERKVGNMGWSVRSGDIVSIRDGYKWELFFESEDEPERRDSKDKVLKAIERALR
jgi:hypothetical protein